ncbi:MULTISPECIES: pseudaminic acid cytidylyltransferase [unclassified Rubrivivax]|uniref:pseudaminic acid cytidylyltransferase n=1 Tax=unclassified Rubrivivax TaxID=2649762 RepID=UPI0013E99B4E|nr:MULTISPECIES: pseudaminic acid cytidylyltransferase [unclassified Rubrivivax]MCC9595861.1 pseudaminic acid cytidylyltransferase [Rubrivivax sp. JA1055]MCC9647799.1 pseudaminic acid cytidylyltransferase [Rubrivivax sp. JA1029]MCD0418122.1 pseudaminic acid cytidylyltransferase [Rubrivivax sp. JA1024]
MNLCVIPARGGSKRIPRKNAKPFCGRPMIAWSIEAALSSACFEHVVVSTDDAEIAQLARRFGAETPFTRPAELSDDFTPTRPVVNHAILDAQQRWGAVDRVCCLYATAPFVRAADLRAGLATLESSGAEFAFTVASFPYPIQRALRRTADGRVQMIDPSTRLTRSQDLEPAFHDAGQFYWGRTSAFLDGLETFSECSVPIVLPRERVQDIDTEEDWRRAELLMRLLDGQEPVAPR